MSFGGLLENGCKVAAWSAPAGPPVDEDEVVICDGLLERVGSEIDGGHSYLQSAISAPLR